MQVEDSDGYFLLIEAADHLPKWVNPKTSLNRCFIYRGQLHLISPPNRQPPIRAQTTGQAREQLTVAQALPAIRDAQQKTVCSVEVQDAVRRRIQHYPAKIGALMHRCRTVLPGRVAFLLARDPALICHSIRAFYHRDDQDVAACRLMKHFPAGGRPVSRLVKLTKFGYAQLLGQHYKPDSKLNWYAAGSANASANVPTGNNSTASTEAEKPFDLGFKISCGFEILASTYVPAERPPAGEQPPRQTANWRSFVSALKSRNYFDNLIEHSAEYDERLAKAQRYFVSSELSEVSSDGALIGHAEIGQRIGELLSEFDEASAGAQLRAEEADQPAEEPDDWLNELPEFLVNSEVPANEHRSFDDLPSEITSGLQEFIRADSDYKGVELDGGSNPKKRKSDLKERAFRMMSDNLRSIITMKVSDSESEQTESDLSDYDYSSAESTGGEEELKYMKGQHRTNKSRKYKEKQNERKKRAKGEQQAAAGGKEIKQLMLAMDEELADTTIGQSFEKLSLLPAANVPMASCAEFDEEDYSTDDESGETKQTRNGLDQIDVEYNTAKNLLGSFKEQNGRSGPASNILQSLGVRIPKDLD